MTDHADLISEARREFENFPSRAAVHPRPIALCLADALEAAQHPTLPSDVDAAIQRLEGAASVDTGPDGVMNVVREDDIRTVIAAAKHPSLTDATRERLAGIIDATVDMPLSSRLVLTDAILAEYVPVVTTRERLAEAFWRASTDRSLHHMTWAEFPFKTYSRKHADAFLASGAVEDRAEVEAKALEAACHEAPPMPGWEEWMPWIAARTASIREARS